MNPTKEKQTNKKGTAQVIHTRNSDIINKPGHDSTLKDGNKRKSADRKGKPSCQVGTSDKKLAVSYHYPERRVSLSHEKHSLLRKSISLE